MYCKMQYIRISKHPERNTGRVEAGNDCSLNGYGYPMELISGKLYYVKSDN